MAYQELPEPIPEGTYVSVNHSGFHRARITEYRGRLGPRGARVYRLIVSRKPRMYTEVIEEQLVVLDEQTSLPGKQ